MKRTIFLALLVLGAGFLLVRQWDKPAYQQELESAFDELLAGIEQAESHLTSLVAMAPPRSLLATPRRAYRPAPSLRGM